VVEVPVEVVVTTLVTELVVVVGVDVVGVVVVPLAVTPSGGSRCRTKAKLAGFPVIWVPTASPFVLERNASPFNVPKFGIDGASSVDHEFVALS